MKFVLITFGLLITATLTFHAVLHNGSLKKYLDTHRDPRWVPVAQYYIGEGYYIFGHLQSSATFYQRVADQYPKSEYADDAYFGYLQDLDDLQTPRPQMAEAYQTYLERFPNGAHTEIVVKRIEYCRNGR